MNRRELEMAIQDLFEGRLEGEAFVGLQGELRRNPEAREAYREYLLLEHNLRFRSKGVDLLRVLPMDRIVARRNLRALRIAGLSAAALLAVTAIVMALVLASNAKPMLAFEISPGTELVVSHRIAGEDSPAGQTLEPGSRLLLEKGTVELRFASGIRSVIRGPADLTLRRDDLLELRKGTGWFDVPPKAVGFQVTTPDLVLTDLGTEFGVISRPDFPDEVHVFKGAVELLNRRGRKATQTLAAQGALAAGPDGHWNGIPKRSEPFLKKLPAGERAFITLDDSASFTSSPRNEMTRGTAFRFESKKELAGFDGGRPDKLVVTLSHEGGSITNVSYGGIKMVPAVEASSAGAQRTAIFYLDSPPRSGDLVATTAGRCNGVGGSILALSNTAPGAPSATGSAKALSARLTTKADNCFLVASHAHNENGETARAETQSPLHRLFAGPTGSSTGGSGYGRMEKPGVVSVSFSGTKMNPVTAVAAFAPIP